MSRIGKAPVEIVHGVTVNVSSASVGVKGPKGELTVKLPADIEAVVENNQVVLTLKKDSNKSNEHGLYRTLVANALVGVSRGWERTLELVGVGFRASGGGRELTLTIGFSHPVKVTAPEGISFTISDNTKVTVSGIDKKVVGEVAANIRKIKPPEPYKGKGIRFLGEQVRRKAGKAVKAAGAAA